MTTNFNYNGVDLSNILSNKSSNSSNNNSYNGFLVNGNSLTFLKPQGSTNTTVGYIYSADWNTTVVPYSQSTTNILKSFAPRTRIYYSPGTFTHTLNSSTVSWAVLLAAGGGGGVGGAQYSGGSYGAGGGGGASGQWIFAYNNSTITNRTLNITIGAGGNGSTGHDTTNYYQYPLDNANDGNQSSISIGGSNIITIYGGYAAPAFTDYGNIGSPGAPPNATVPLISSGISIIYFSHGVRGQDGYDEGTNPAGGAPGINNYASPINIFNSFVSTIPGEATVTLSTLGEGGRGGDGETTNNGTGAQDGFPGTGGLAIIFEYIFPIPTLPINQLYTTNQTMSNIIMPYGKTNFNFALCGAGGDGAQTDTDTYGGGGSGGWIQALNIPYTLNSATISSISILFNSSNYTKVQINYTNNTYILLMAGNGARPTNASGNNGAPGGTCSITNTTSWNSSLNYGSVSGAAGGNKNASGNTSGKTSSGSGANSTSSSVNSINPAGPFAAFSLGMWSVTSQGGGRSPTVVSGYGAGGASTPGNYDGSGGPGPYKTASGGCCIMNLT
jgi:hypothetical protein